MNLIHLLVSELRGLQEFVIDLGLGRRALTHSQNMRSMVQFFLINRYLAPHAMYTPTSGSAYPQRLTSDGLISASPCTALYYAWRIVITRANLYGDLTKR